METILQLFKECYEHGIYNRGAGGDNPNVVASILRGIDPRETLTFHHMRRLLAISYGANVLYQDSS